MTQLILGFMLLTTLASAECVMLYPVDRAYLVLTSVSLTIEASGCGSSIARLRGVNDVQQYFPWIQPYWTRRRFYVTPDTLAWNCSPVYCWRVPLDLSRLQPEVRIIVDYEKVRSGRTLRRILQLYFIVE